MDNILLGIQSFKELDPTDKLICLQAFKRSPSDRCLQHKYLKRTEDIIERTKDFSSEYSYCFLTFDVMEISDRFVMLVFMLNGILDNYRFVLYYNVMSNKNIETRIAPFIVDIFSNLLQNDIPKIEQLCLKFVLLKHSKWTARALDKLLQMDFQAKIMIAYTPCELQRYIRTHKDVYNAVSDIMYTKITRNNVKSMFDGYKQLFQNLISDEVHSFFSEFEMIAYDLLETNSEFVFTNCTYERTRDFIRLLDLHFNSIKTWPMKLVRLFVFEHIRAVIAIFDY